jgi:integrase
MPRRPPGLKFSDRIAPYEDGHYFFCQRAGHSPLLRLIPGMKKDAEAFRSAHDTAYHNMLLRHVGLKPAQLITVHRLCAEWLKHVQKLEIEGDLNHQTTAHYEYTCDILKEAFSRGERAGDLDPSRISRFVHWMKENRKKSKGPLTVKCLQTLRTMLAWKHIEPLWSIPYREIRPESVEQRDDLGPDLIARFIAHLPYGSLEHAVAAMKAHTGMRNIEIYEARVGDIDIEEKVIEPLLFNKTAKRKKRHVYPLTDELTEVLRPFVEGKPDDALLFTIEGRKLRKESLRGRFIKASTAAEIDPPIRAIKEIRHEVVTVITDELDLGTASKWIGHDSEKTTKRFYYRDRRTKKKLDAKRQVAQLLARAIPIGRPGHEMGHGKDPKEPSGTHPSKRRPEDVKKKSLRFLRGLRGI